MAWTDVKTDRHQAWQAPAWLSVTPPSLRSGRCQDDANASLWRSVPPEVVQNGCRRANALLRVTGSAFFFSKEVPSVSDSGASATYCEYSKQSCHFCILRVWTLKYYHRQGCLLSWEILGVAWCMSFLISIHLVESMLSSKHHSRSRAE